MLTLNSNDDHSTCFKFIGMDSQQQSTHLITDNTSLITLCGSLLSSGSDGMDTCSFYSGPSDASIMAFAESCGSIAYGETCGTIAYSGGGETCGTIASSFSCSSSSSSFSGGCSYSC